jgi:hypothetical protein
MNGIGITEWQNNETGYPLVSAGQLSGLFCDASFVSYDSFIPVLTNVAVSTTQLILTIQMDDGLHQFSFPITSIVQGYGTRLRTATRSYGSVVFGRLSEDLVSGTLGNNITANCRFDSSTVRTIDSTNGVYSVAGLSGTVSVLLDGNFMYNASSLFGYPTLSAVSLPNSLEVLQTDSNNSYALNSNRVLQRVDNSGLVDLTVLDKTYYQVISHGAYLIGANIQSSITSLYDLATQPSTKKLSGIPGRITALTVNGSGDLVALIGDKLFNLGGYPYTYNPSNGIPTGVVNGVGMVFYNGVYLIYTNGMRDYSASGTVYLSNFVYAVTVSGSSATSDFLGLLVDPTIDNSSNFTDNQHVPWLNGMFISGSQIYGWSAIDGNYLLFSIDPNSLNVTTVHSCQYSPAVYQNATFVGGSSIILNSVTPLKTINNLSPTDNQINFMGSDTVSINPSASDTIKVNLAVNDAQLNVFRSTTYE